MTEVVEWVSPRRGGRWGVGMCVVDVEGRAGKVEKRCY